MCSDCEGTLQQTQALLRVQNGMARRLARELEDERERVVAILDEFEAEGTDVILVRRIRDRVMAE